MKIATWKQGQGARYSKTLAKIAKEHKGIEEYYFEDGSHWVILHDDYNCDYSSGPLEEYEDVDGVTEDDPIAEGTYQGK